MCAFLITLVGVWYKGHRHSAARHALLWYIACRIRALPTPSTAKLRSNALWNPFFLFYFLQFGGIHKLHWQASGIMGLAKDQRSYIMPISCNERVIMVNQGCQKPHKSANVVCEWLFNTYRVTLVKTVFFFFTNISIHKNFSLANTWPAAYVILRMRVRRIA